MDFSFSEEQQAIAELAQADLRRQARRHERLRAARARAAARASTASSGARSREAGLLGIAVPEAHGGAGLGFLEVALILEQIGARTRAPIPLLETVVLGALPIAEFGSAAQQRALAAARRGGELVLTRGARTRTGGEPGTRPRRRRATARLALRGAKLCVPAGEIAERVLVPAATGAGTLGVFLVDPRGARRRARAARHHERAARGARSTLDGVQRAAPTTCSATPRAGARIVAWLEPRAIAALCARAARRLRGRRCG